VLFKPTSNTSVAEVVEANNSLNRQILVQWALLPQCKLLRCFLVAAVVNLHPQEVVKMNL